MCLDCNWDLKASKGPCDPTKCHVRAESDTFTNALDEDPADIVKASRPKKGSLDSFKVKDAYRALLDADTTPDAAIDAVRKGCAAVRDSVKTKGEVQ